MSMQIVKFSVRFLGTNFGTYCNNVLQLLHEFGIGKAIKQKFAVWKWNAKSKTLRRTFNGIFSLFKWEKCLVTDENTDENTDKVNIFELKSIERCVSKCARLIDRRVSKTHWQKAIPFFNEEIANYDVCSAFYNLWSRKCRFMSFFTFENVFHSPYCNTAQRILSNYIRSAFTHCVLTTAHIGH